MVERLEVQFSEPFRQRFGPVRRTRASAVARGREAERRGKLLSSADDSPAVIYQAEDGPIERVSVAELRSMAGRVANGLAELGMKAGDRVAIDMPMTVESVAIYLGAVAAGCPVVAVADSFAPAEIAVRLGIGQARCIFTQDFALRLGKRLPLYEKVRAAERRRRSSCRAAGPLTARCATETLPGKTSFPSGRISEAVPRDPSDVTTILFSSGTSGAPKAIPWDQTTPIKAAVDAHLHHDIHPGDVLCWPSNMGWMMGPWLVYAALMNKATMALFSGARDQPEVRSVRRGRRGDHARPGSEPGLRVAERRAAWTGWTGRASACSAPPVSAPTRGTCCS